MLETQTPHNSNQNEETGQLTFAMLQEIHAKLCNAAIPNPDWFYSFIVFFSLWERIVYRFSPRYALKLYADRQIRNWGKEHGLSPDESNSHAGGASRKEISKT